MSRSWRRPSSSSEPARSATGATGERIAAWWLAARGLHILDRNVTVTGGEIDLIARDGTRRVAVEVRTITGGGDPIDAIDESKRSHVNSLAAGAGASRVDLVGVALDRDALVVHWVPG